MSHGHILPFKDSFLLDYGSVELFPQETWFYKFGWTVGAE